MTNDSIPQDPLDFSKRYWLFGYPEYEAGGGINDFIASYDTIEEAQISGEALQGDRTLDYMHIFDSKSLKEASHFTYYSNGWKSPDA